MRAPRCALRIGYLAKNFFLFPSDVRQRAHCALHVRCSCITDLLLKCFYRHVLSRMKHYEYAAVSIPLASRDYRHEASGSRAHARGARLRDLSKLLPHRKSAAVGNSRESDLSLVLSFSLEKHEFDRNS